MSIFTPPTDNLYKFVALTGILLIVAFIFPILFFYQVGMEYLAQLRGSDELQVQEKFVSPRLETLKLREQQAKDERDKLQKRLDELNAASNSTEVDKLEGRIKETNREIQSIADSIHELSLNLELKRAQVNSEDTVSYNRRGDSRVFLYIGAGGVVLGFGFAIFGFLFWYVKLQRFLDIVVAKEAEDKLAAPANKEIEPVPPAQLPEANAPESTK